MPPDGRWLARLSEGPVTVAELFELAALYYERPATIGAGGDFVTAPEISQCFGELIGLWLADQWQRQGRPAPVVLAELGPGRGTLMADLWRATSVVPGFHDAVHVHLVERSRSLRAAQAERLALARPRFVDDVVALPMAPLFLIANEFLDALAMHQLVRRAGTWTERCAGLGGGKPEWRERLAPAALATLADARFGTVDDGAVVELAPAREGAVRDVAERVTRDGGAALFIDYGAAGDRPAETLQAVRRHETVSLLSCLGEADVTSAVAFVALHDAAVDAGAATHGPVPQGRFLRDLGIELRAARLAGSRPRAERERIFAGVRRLLAPEAMGELFKAFAVLPQGAPLPPGFADAPV